MSKHIYHYNVNGEQRYFLDKERELYDLIALNGNIVSHTPAGVAAFLANAGKDFFIDPQTHAFQHSTLHLKRDISDKEKGEPPNLEFKPSIVKLAKERLGGPFAQVISNDRPLSPNDFLSADGLNQNVIASVCEGVIGFQTKTMIESLDEEAQDFLGGTNHLQPSFLIAPYFYLSPELYKEWLEITLACYQVTKVIAKNTPICLALVISREAIDAGAKHIIEAVSQLKPDGILLWIDEHVEEDISKSEIERYINLVKGLRNSTEFLFNIHGGYLSILLSHSDAGSLLSGVGHSINYGESRSVVPIGGGIPMARFYFPSIHSRIRFGDASAIAFSKKWLSSAEVYRQNICTCRQCVEFLSSSKSIDEAFFKYGESNPVTFRRRSGSIVSLEYPAKAAKQAAARHYLYNKAKEFEELSEKPLDEILRNLPASYKEISPYSGDKLVAHLPIWERAIRPLLAK